MFCVGEYGMKMPLKKKLSIDFWQSNYDRLDTFISSLETVAPNTVINKGYIVNYLVESVIDIDDTVREELYAFCYDQMKTYYAEAEKSQGFEKADRNNKAQQYEKLVNLFNNFRSYQNPPKLKQPMKRIDLKEGYVVFPADWIIIETVKPSQCRNVYVIEIRDRKNQYHAPHFLVLGNVPCDKLDDYYSEQIYRKCTEAYPEFAKWMSMQVDPVYGERNENGVRKLLNAEEFDNSPAISIFQLPEFGDNKVGEYPFGAMLVPNKKEQ